MIDWRNISLLGIDVGFSKTAKSTGIAVYDRGRLITLTCIGSSPQNRSDALPPGLSFDAIAIDGPIVPGIDRFAARECEKILSRGKFSRRCKPAMSHFGFGLPLRRASKTIADEMVDHAKPSGKYSGPHQVYPGKAIVEAFPNSFLGVLLDDDDYCAMGKLGAGKSLTFSTRVSPRRNALIRSSTYWAGVMTRCAQCFTTSPKQPHAPRTTNVPP